jgi:probable addiction module antidote protein
MPLETRVFDPARYLDSDEARAAYMTEALETGDPVFIGDALGVIARARGLNKVAREAGLSGDELDRTLGSDGTSQLGQLLRVIHALGLRLTVRPATP